MTADIQPSQSNQARLTSRTFKGIAIAMPFAVLAGALATPVWSWWSLVGGILGGLLIDLAVVFPLYVWLDSNGRSDQWGEAFRRSRTECFVLLGVGLASLGLGWGWLPLSGAALGLLLGWLYSAPQSRPKTHFSSDLQSYAARLLGISLGFRTAGLATVFSICIWTVLLWGYSWGLSQAGDSAWRGRVALEFSLTVVIVIHYLFAASRGMGPVLVSPEHDNLIPSSHEETRSADVAADIDDGIDWDAFDDEVDGQRSPGVSEESQSNQTDPVHAERTIPSHRAWPLMTNAEMHAFGIQLILQHMVDEGVEVESVNTDASTLPQLVGKRWGSLAYIFVKTTCSSTRASLTEQEFMARYTWARDRGATPFFAAVNLVCVAYPDKSTVTHPDHFFQPFRNGGFAVGYQGLVLMAVGDGSGDFR